MIWIYLNTFCKLGYGSNIFHFLTNWIGCDSSPKKTGVDWAITNMLPIAFHPHLIPTSWEMWWFLFRRFVQLRSCHLGVHERIVQFPMPNGKPHPKKSMWLGTSCFCEGCDRWIRPQFCQNCWILNIVWLWQRQCVCNGWLRELQWLMTFHWTIFG